MELPKYSDNAKIGEAGITILRKIVEKEFGWLLRPNHKENDFGIDVYLDIITDKGGVTGKTIAAQVKTGASYFTEESEYGWVYRDVVSHLNYYLNHDIPVVVILVDETKEKAFWCHCNPLETERAGNSWKIIVPKNNELNSASKNMLLGFISPVKDYVSQLENFWKENEKLTNAGRIILSLDKEDILNCEYENLAAVIARFQVNVNLIRELKGKVDITIDGYNDDDRELYEIPEVSNWCTDVFANVQGFTYFMATDEGSSFLRLLQYFRVDYKILKDWQFDSNGKKYGRIVEFNFATCESFLNDLYSDLNHFCIENNIPIEINKEISFNMAEHILREKIPDEIKNKT